MARLMLSAGMFSALAAATAVRRRGFFSTSPPLLAAMLISLMRRVKILPRLASSAPFLCLIVAHLEWPDINRPRKVDDYRMPIAPHCGHENTSASEGHGRAGQAPIIALRCSGSRQVKLSVRRQHVGSSLHLECAHRAHQGAVA